MNSTAASSPTPHEIQLHWSWLTSVVRSRVASEHVDDILGDTMADAVEQLQKSSNGIENLGPWLYRVAIRKILQFRRRDGRYRKLKEQYSQSKTTHSNWQQSPIELFLGEERKELVQQAVKRLSGKDAEILTLKYVHGWSYELISKNLGISKSKIANRLRTAKRNFRQQLELLGVAPEEN